MANGETRKVIEEYEFGDTPADRLIAEDAVFTVMATGETAKGRDAVLALLHRWYLDAFSDASTTVRNVAADEDKGLAFIEFTFKGTHTGETHGLPPSGRTVELPFLNIYAIREGKIAEARLYYDVQTLRDQIEGAGRGSE